MKSGHEEKILIAKLHSTNQEIANLTISIISSFLIQVPNLCILKNFPFQVYLSSNLSK